MALAAARALGSTRILQTQHRRASPSKVPCGLGIAAGRRRLRRLDFRRTGFRMPRVSTMSCDDQNIPAGRRALASSARRSAFTWRRPRHEAYSNDLGRNAVALPCRDDIAVTGLRRQKGHLEWNLCDRCRGCCQDMCLRNPSRCRMAWQVRVQMQVSDEGWLVRRKTLQPQWCRV